MKNMLNIICLVIAVTYGMLFPAGSKAIEKPSSIHAVTVYPDRAMVTRELSVSVSSGRHSVKFSNLPLGLINDSVQVTGKGTAASTLLDVQVKREFQTKKATIKKGPLQERRKQIESQMDLLKDDLAILEKKEKFLERLMSKTLDSMTAAKDSKPVSLADYKSMPDWKKPATDFLLKV